MCSEASFLCGRLGKEKVCLSVCTFGPTFYCCALLLHKMSLSKVDQAICCIFVPIKIMAKDLMFAIFLTLQQLEDKCLPLCWDENGRIEDWYKTHWIRLWMSLSPFGEWRALLEFLLSFFPASSESDRGSSLRMTFNPTFDPGSRDPSAESVTSLISTSTGTSISPQSTIGQGTSLQQASQPGLHGPTGGSHPSLSSRPHSITSEFPSRHTCLYWNSLW